MDLEESALAGMAAGAAAGTVKATFATAAYLVFREQVIAETRTALEAQDVATAGMDATTIYWANAVVIPPSVVLLTVMVGTVVALALGWRGSGSAPVVYGVSALVGVGDGFTTHLSGVGRPPIVAVSVLAWLLFGAVFVRATSDDRDLGDLRPDANVDRRLVAALLVAGSVGVGGLAPLLLAADLSPAALVANLVLTLGLVAVAVVVGTVLGPAVDLGAPDVAAWLDGRAPDPDALAVAAAAGTGAGVLILGLDLAVFAPLIEDAVRDGGAAGLGDAPAWARLVAGVLYGGVVEELLLRLGLMTALVWVAWRAGRRDGDAPAEWVYWGAIGVTALAFGALHLPATAAALELTPVVVARALVLNGVGGVVFGWLYWRRSLLAAMVTHASANVVMQGVAMLMEGVAVLLG